MVWECSGLAVISQISPFILISNLINVRTPKHVSYKWTWPMTKAKSGLREMPATDYDHNKQNLQVHYIQQKCIINHMPASQNMVPIFWKYTPFHSRLFCTNQRIWDLATRTMKTFSCTQVKHQHKRLHTKRKTYFKVAYHFNAKERMHVILAFIFGNIIISTRELVNSLKAKFKKRDFLKNKLYFKNVLLLKYSNLIYTIWKSRISPWCKGVIFFLLRLYQIWTNLEDFMASLSLFLSPLLKKKNS